MVFQKEVIISAINHADGQLEEVGSITLPKTNDELKQGVCNLLGSTHDIETTNYEIKDTDSTYAFVFTPYEEYTLPEINSLIKEINEQGLAYGTLAILDKLLISSESNNFKEVVASVKGAINLQVKGNLKDLLNEAKSIYEKEGLDIEKYAIAPLHKELEKVGFENIEDNFLYMDISKRYIHNNQDGYWYYIPTTIA